ncbi:NAD-dependent succinate-semialdehyde dehydrogenase [Phenylobacterium sp.]|uniref:NAD-dependent succinate-semialdehyde dehydrogenase n=1 Tax=Phenylobacterium sp. TaxID=1871053 RepID=UPI00391CED14
MSEASTNLGLKRPDLLRQEAYVAGQWMSADRAIVVRNPATGGALAQVPDLGAAATERAVEAAFEAQQKWAGVSAKTRAAVLRRWFELMLAHQEDLARLMTAEQGKPLTESRGEIAYAAAFLEWFGEEAKRAYGDVTPGHQADRRLLTLKQPVGVVGAVTPWNFPSAMITRKVGPAVAAGCAVVLKPSELTPLSALALAVLAEEAGLPPGIFNVVTGAPAPIGEVLTQDPRVAKFTFTGSTAVGKMLAAQCMGTVKRVSLELGGNAPFIVFEDADLDAAVEGALASKFRNAGQTCVCANRFYVHASVQREFASRLAARVAEFRVGDGLQGPTDQGPLIDDRAIEKVQRHVDDAVRQGAEVLTGGGRIGDVGHFFAPTVLSGVDASALLTREETFGPVAGLIPFETEQQAVSLANATRAGLASYFYTADAKRTWRMAEALQYGMVGVNTGLISTEMAPFGGIKESGLGREGSRHGLDEYLSLKAVCLAVD